MKCFQGGKAITKNSLFYQLSKYKSNDVVKNYVDYLTDTNSRTIVQILFLLLTEKTKVFGQFPLKVISTFLIRGVISLDFLIPLPQKKGLMR